MTSGALQLSKVAFSDLENFKIFVSGMFWERVLRFIRYALRDGRTACARPAPCMHAYTYNGPVRLSGDRACAVSRNVTVQTAQLIVFRSQEVAFVFQQIQTLADVAR